MKRAAFTLVEIIVVIALIGVVTTMIAPRLMRQPVATEWPVILDNLNNLISFARQEAIANQVIHRVTFHAHQQGSDFVTVEAEAPDPEKPGRKVYNEVSSFYCPSRYDFADVIRISAVSVGRQNLIDSKGMASCYVIPDGLVQEIMLKLTRKINNADVDVRFIMNPFWGRFEIDEGA